MQQQDGGPDTEYEAIFRSSPVGMAVMDSDGRFVRANPALCRFLGRDAGWLLGRSPDDVTLPEDAGQTGLVERRLRDVRRAERVHKRYLRPDGTVVHGLVSAVALGGEGRDRRTLAQIEDATEQFRLEHELRRLATHDPLTGLPGRRLLLSRLQEALGGAGDGGPRSVAVIFVDLDAFKLVNDALGHAAGDAVLVEVARRFVGAVRAEDTVGRLAGDEFLVVSSDLADADDARALAQRLEDSLRAPVPFRGDEVFVSASIGVTFRPALDEQPSEDLVAQLLRDADTAMYEAKRHGKRRYEVFDSGMRAQADERSRVAGRLRAAVAEERLVVHYQPVVALPSLVPIGVEAVVRVRDTDGTVLLPAAFLEVAEQIGVLPQLDRHVLQVASRQVQQWRDATGLDLHLSVNVSAGQLLRSLAEQVEDALQASRLPPSRLSLELTEQTFIDGVQAAVDTLHRVVATGVNLAIDDFGTGWASLTYLRRFPVNAIKIDRSFVTDLTRSPQDGIVVGALAQLAAALELACVVEGVESAEQLDRLLALVPDGLGYAQGYLFGRPLPADEALAVLLAGSSPHGAAAGA